ncbi:MAG TPA: ATP synthase F1 subunit delta [Bryobacteraceae bacterium]|nr:ATP synthase F1 subunit delta [Bryobacteraceae bacterium]HPT27853.1 ATP synthase F1 subunit delta [Bryobacteraceae bacterium]
MSIAVANQYAKALLEVVLKPGAEVPASEVLRQLETFRDALAASPELREVMMTPAISAEAKQRALLRIASLLGLSPVVVRFLHLVRDRRRIPLTGDICLMFREQMDQRLGILHAHVASARELAPSQREALAERLSTATGKSVDLDYSVDSGLVGGAKVTIGSTVYDGSVRGQLEGLRLRLTSEG